MTYHKSTLHQRLKGPVWKTKTLPSLNHMKETIHPQIVNLNLHTHVTTSNATFNDYKSLIKLLILKIKENQQDHCQNFSNNIKNIINMIT